LDYGAMETFAEKPEEVEMKLQVTLKLVIEENSH
jgi:hypothetical protein